VTFENDLDWEDRIYNEGYRDGKAELRAENERLRAPWRNVDERDWIDAFALLGDGGRGKFWRAVLAEMRSAMENKG
jgi:hypothetical protein